jgi:hypothetical protein
LNPIGNMVDTYCNASTVIRKTAKVMNGKYLIYFNYFLA